MPDYLITGGAGFIGGHLAERLVRDGKSVRILDNFSSGRENNLNGCGGKVEVIRGDLRDRDAVARAVSGTRVVFHLAAMVSVPQSVADPQTAHEVNVNGTLNLFLAARDAGVRRVVFSSSSAVYGDSPDQPKREDMRPAPISPYGLHKLIGEQYARLFHRLYGLEVVSLRYFNVFGPRQDPTSPYAAAIPRFISRLLAGQPPIVFGDGRQTRDFTYVENVIEANLAAAAAPAEAVGESFNIASGASTSVNDLIATLNRILGTNIVPIHDPPRSGDILHSAADISKAARILNCPPRVDLATGLRRTLEWYRGEK
ncbi:MAG: SDR family oxidoreductase [Verrucomicrobiae bacterium]|nr:SDR family oxidoreductase [Verrucomicrobiae bacterium]